MHYFISFMRIKQDDYQINITMEYEKCNKFLNISKDIK